MTKSNVKLIKKPYKSYLCSSLSLMNMRFYYLLFFLCFILIKTQTPVVSGNFKINIAPYKKKVLDQSIQNIYYKLFFVKDSKKSNNKLETLCVLQMSKNFSKFSDFNKLKMDSLMEVLSQKGEADAKDVNKALAIKVQWDNSLIKDIKEEKYIYQETITATYQYEEAFPKFNWELENESKDILGYNCRKATTQYRGRKYTAWYTTDIPINNGPYVFQGLPGLIMELEDSKNQYHFTVVAMDKKENEIYLRNEKEIFHIDRDKFRKIHKSFNDNPNFFLDPVYDSNGNPVTFKSKSRPYNPIELE